MSKILIVDDEGAIRRTLSEILKDENYEVDTASNGKECLAAIEKKSYDVILLDIKMPKLDGIEVLHHLRSESCQIPIIMMSGFIDKTMGVAVMRDGAFDVLTKPVDLNRLLITIKNAVDKNELTRPKRPKGIRINKNLSHQMIGGSPKMLQLKEKILKIGAYDFRVMITGPNGAGKELVARNLHQNSIRSKGPFIAVNCAAIPESLIESTLFGHEKGAFTGALKMVKGKFEEANGGTLFLDEIGDMPLNAQAKILRVLSENKITRVGSNKEIEINCRVIAATNRDMFEMISNSSFREDLYFRLAMVSLKVPSLNERREDIPGLVNHFINDICMQYNVPARRVSPEAMEALQGLDYRGNIRELRNMVYRLVVFAEQDIHLKDVMDLE